MSLEQNIADLVTATTSLTEAVNVKKQNLDEAVIDAQTAAASVQIKEQEREQIFEDAQEERENEFSASQIDKQNRFNDFIASSGYQFLANYAAGIEITEYNQVLRDTDGELWRLSGKVELPYTTTGAGLPEDDSLTPLGDAVLRQELAGPGGAALVGLKHGTLADSIYYYTPEMFGAVGDGVADDLPALQILASTANSDKKVVKFQRGKTYKLLGASNIRFETSVDFNNAIIDVEDFSGLFDLSSPNEWVTYGPTSSVVQALQTDTTLTTRYWSGWDGVSEVEESFVRIWTDQPFYSYREEVQNRWEWNVVTHKGHVLSELQFPLDTSTIASIEVLKINKEYTRYNDLVLRFGSRDINYDVVRIVDGSKIKVNGISYIRDTGHIHSIANPNFLGIYGCCHVEVSGLDYSFPAESTATTSFAYLMSMSGSYDVKIVNATGSGEGWGAAGNNRCQRVVFESCELNRIDFHHPFREYLKVKDCNISSNGGYSISIAAIGDLIIDGGSTSVYPNSTGAVDNRFITLRSDSNAIAEGDLIVKNHRIFNRSGEPVLAINASYSEANLLPVGSPLTGYFWKSVNFEHVSCEGNSLTVGHFGGNSTTVDSEEVILKNCSGFSYTENPQANQSVAVGQGPIATTPINKRLSFSNCKFNKTGLRFTKDSDKYNIKVNINNCESIDSLGIYLETIQRGYYSISESSVEQIDFFYGSVPTQQIQLSITDSVINHDGSILPTFIVGGSAPSVDWCIERCLMNFSDSSSLTGIQNIMRGVVKNNKLSIAGSEPKDYFLISSDGTSLTLPPGISLNNRIGLLTGGTESSPGRIDYIYPPHDVSVTTKYYYDSNTEIDVTSASNFRHNLTVTAPNFVGARIYV